MLEEYYRLKMKYKEYILLIKVGNFYEILDKDAMIIHQILRYQLTRLSDTVKCGFPITNLEKVLTTLDTKEMNYVVIENKNIVRERSFENNIYSSFQFDTNVFKYNVIRINKIVKFLNDNVFHNISEKLEQIEEIIYGR